MSGKLGPIDRNRAFSLIFAFAMAACQGEVEGIERGLEQRMGNGEEVAAEQPPILSIQEYEEARNGTIEGDQDSATIIVGYLEYLLSEFSEDLTEEQQRDRSLGYEVMAIKGLSCDTFDKVVNNEDIYRYIDHDNLAIIREMHERCDGRYGYIDSESGEWRAPWDRDNPGLR